MTNKRLVIFGCGGHGRSVADVALVSGYKYLIFVDPNARPRERVMGFPVVQRVGDLGSSWGFAIAASGDGKERYAQCDLIAKAGLKLVSVVSPRATLGVASSLGVGSFVGHHAHIGPLACIGRGCIVNSGAIVEHESSVGEFAHVAVNACVCGRSSLGSFCMLGAGATVSNSVSVAGGVTIGAGAVVVSPIESSGVFVGVPARPVN